MALAVPASLVSRHVRRLSRFIPRWRQQVWLELRGAQVMTRFLDCSLTQLCSWNMSYQVIYSTLYAWSYWTSISVGIKPIINEEVPVIDNERHERQKKLGHQSQSQNQLWDEVRFIQTVECKLKISAIESVCEWTVRWFEFTTVAFNPINNSRIKKVEGICIMFSYSLCKNYSKIQSPRYS